MPRVPGPCLLLSTSSMSADRPPTASEWSLKLKEAQVRPSPPLLPRTNPASQATGSRATTLELSGSFDAAFSSYLRAAQGYLFLIRHTQDGEVKQRLRGVSGKLLERAERIKKAKKVGVPVLRDRMALGEYWVPWEGEGELSVVQRSRISYSRQRRSWRASGLLDGHRKMLCLRPGLLLPRAYTTNLGRLRTHSDRNRNTQPALAPAQIQARVDWKRATQVLPNAAMVFPASSGKDIVQDNLTDCSLVAALIVGAEHHSKFGSKVRLLILELEERADGGGSLRWDACILRIRAGGLCGANLGFTGRGSWSTELGDA